MINAKTGNTFFVEQVAAQIKQQIDRLNMHLKQASQAGMVVNIFLDEDEEGTLTIHHEINFPKGNRNGNLQAQSDKPA